MASITRRLLLQSRQCPPRIRARASPRHNIPAQWQQRPLSTSPRLCADEPTKEGSATAADAQAPTQTLDEPAPELSYSNTTPETPFNKMTEEERRDAMLTNLRASLAEIDPSVVADAQRKGRAGLPQTQDFGLETDEDFFIEEDDKRKIQSGFWAEGEETMGPDEDYYGDDLTSHGHGELEQHRELREYARLIAWELPLLGHLARPFEPPTAATPYRFRYTSYLGESHPATNKVVVEFSPQDLTQSDALTPIQVSKMIKLAGPRYNPSSQIVKMSCEKFDTQARNKRFLADTIATLIKEAKDATDTFEDVPFDFRHHNPKKRTEFPKEWVLTQERKSYLEEKRRKTVLLEDQKKGNGELVDGARILDTSLPFMNQSLKAPQTVMAGGARGKSLV
ncbi:37S ribosomal Rsm24 [Pyrenophora seminiperda CCB06]|uniref:37S ribosomal Rsm24 n=1 Tax=Pyrenophora seminiperda CCB06 TaxID=1302712 RepID=A0A3M7MH74_9PLEO|nr:37S ribosomal Rsm24 [Pyrenophora seminiperda CCB06]